MSKAIPPTIHEALNILCTVDPDRRRRYNNALSEGRYNIRRTEPSAILRDIRCRELLTSLNNEAIEEATALQAEQAISSANQGDEEPDWTNPSTPSRPATPYADATILGDVPDAGIEFSDLHQGLADAFTQNTLWDHLIDLQASGVLVITPAGWVARCADQEPDGGEGQGAAPGSFDALMSDWEEAVA